MTTRFEAASVSKFDPQAAWHLSMLVPRQACRPPTNEKPVSYLVFRDAHP